jgi:hypothetical protein
MMRRRARRPSLLGSAHAKQATGTQRASRLQEMEIPRCGTAGAPGPAAGRNAGARLATALHSRQDAEDAAREAETSYWNTRPAFERTRRR